ncbi:MAG: hypothetical protein WCB53_17100 [Terriglobales bacterium]
MKSFPRSTYGYVSLLSIALASLAAIPLAAQELDCHPCWHGFGKVPTGSSASFNINLRNSGTQSLNITSDAVQGSEFSVGTFPLPLTLEPGASVQIPLIFTPTTLGGATGRVTLENTGRDSSLMLKLGGTGVNQSSHSVALSWVPGDQDYVGFNVYRSTVQGGPYTKLNSTLDGSPAYTDTSVEGGMTYYYAATEVNSQGEESAYSNIAEAEIPGS